MKIIPAIDLIGGKCVRLSQGDYSQTTSYDQSPLEIAKSFEAHGITRLHLVDLDGAKKGSPVNMNILEDITQSTELKVDFSGGLRTKEDLLNAFNAGATYVAIGSAAVKAPEQVGGWLKEFGAEKFILGADVRERVISISGWQEDTELRIDDYIRGWSENSFEGYLCTSIAKDGLLSGPDIELYSELLTQFSDLPFIASGGVTTVDDLHRVKDIGMDGAIIGKALYEGKMSLSDLEPFLC